VSNDPTNSVKALKEGYVLKMTYFAIVLSEYHTTRESNWAQLWHSMQLQHATATHIPNFIKEVCMGV